MYLAPTIDIELRPDQMNALPIPAELPEGIGELLQLRSFSCGENELTSELLRFSL